MRWDEVLDTVTMTRWAAYEAEWASAPLVDDLVAAYLGWNAPTDAGAQAAVEQKQPCFDDFFADVMKRARSKEMPDG